MQLGDTFVWAPNPERSEHLYIAVTDPNGNNGTFVAFNLTRSTGGKMALTFRVGQHPFITRYDSDVNFGDGLLVNLQNLEALISSGDASMHKPIDGKMLRLIADTAKTHPAVSEEIQDMIKAQWP